MKPLTLSRLLGCERGASAVEFALAVPILLASMVGLADFGLAVNEKMRLTSAVRAGVQYAKSNQTNTVGTQNATLAAANGLSASAVTVTLTCGCSDGSTVSCSTGTCPAAAPWEYVTVTASENYPLLVNYPGIGNTVALSANASLRLF